MRFIHTADWHLGNQMHDIDRRKESAAFLKWLKKQIAEKQAETLIVSGDIFDTVNPSVEARRLYYTFLASLVDSCCKNVIIIGGNHDSAVMLDSAKELLDVLNIHVVGSINNLSPGDMCFELRDRNENVNGICMALPFVREVELRNLLSDSRVEDGDLYSLAYKKLYSTVFDEAEKLRACRDIPVIATGHLYANNIDGRSSQGGNQSGRGMRRDDGTKVLDVLGTLGFVPPAVFPPADYVALGHIHYATMVEKNPAIRYSGSPFVMGFDEADISHYVLCVDLSVSGGKSGLKVEPIKTESFFDYRRLSGTLAEIKEMLENFSASNENGTFLELCYKRELGINARDYLEEAINALSQNVSVVSWKLSEQDRIFSAENREQLDAVEIKNLDDREIFTQLILSKSALEKDSKEAKEAIEKFLPLFLKIAAE